MKKAKNLLLISIGVIFIGMIILYSCRSYTGPVKKVDGDKLDNNLDSGSEEEDYFDTINNCIIPALTVTKNNTLIAAIGDKNNAGKILIKTSKDGGTNWSAYNGSIKNDDIATGFAHPFFINCYDGSILLGIATTNETENIVSFYRGKGDGSTWTKENAKIKMPQKTTNQVNKELTPQNAFATYGNGLALKHGGNTNTLLFLYYYKDSSGSGAMSTMISTDNGASWKANGKDQGVYSSYGAKFIEIENGNILYFLNGDAGIAWFKSVNKGETETLSQTFYKSSLGNPMYADFVRYEFDGQDIKSDGSKYALMAYSFGGSYGVKLTTDDFNDGQNTGSGTFYYQEVGTSSLTETYPSITVLRDGTICTLAAEDNTMVFRRFELKWLMGETDY